MHDEKKPVQHHCIHIQHRDRQKTNTVRPPCDTPSCEATVHGAGTSPVRTVTRHPRIPPTAQHNTSLQKLDLGENQITVHAQNALLQAQGKHRERSKLFLYLGEGSENGLGENEFQ